MHRIGTMIWLGGWGISLLATFVIMYLVFQTNAPLLQPDLLQAADVFRMLGVLSALLFPPLLFMAGRMCFLDLPDMIASRALTLATFIISIADAICAVLLATQFVLLRFTDIRSNVVIGLTAIGYVLGWLTAEITFLLVLRRIDRHLTFDPMRRNRPKRNRTATAVNLYWLVVGVVYVPAIAVAVLFDKEIADGRAGRDKDALTTFLTLTVVMHVMLLLVGVVYANVLGTCRQVIRKVLDRFSKTETK
jgi:hypothetical protein